MSVEHFGAVEGIEFAAHVQGADDMDMFFGLTRSSGPVMSLYAARDSDAVLGRIRTLTERTTDLDFLHPHDVACAVYLDLLSRFGASDAVEEAYGCCVSYLDRMYWTTGVAKALNIRGTEAPGNVRSAAVQDPQSSPSVTPDALAAVLYGLYNAAAHDLAPADQKPPPRPDWSVLPADHFVRRLMRTTCERLLDRLDATPCLVRRGASDRLSEVVTQMIQGSKIQARLTLRGE